MVSGFIIQYFGWPTIFYINGTCGTVWSLFYMYYGSDSPQKSKLITTEEKDYIQSSIQVFEESKVLVLIHCCSLILLILSMPKITMFGYLLLNHAKTAGHI
ncbi:unnamed protein product [Spodoptera exigua]|nr:unnamed protein product [Spodoptera exigua]